MQAPEKIYVTNDRALMYFHTDKLADDDIEYTRTDAFIKKVINFLNYKLDDVVAIRAHGTIIPHRVAKEELIEDLEKYIKE